MTNRILEVILKQKGYIGMFILGSFVLFILYTVFIYKTIYKTDAKIFIRNVPQYNVATNSESDNSLTSSQSGYSNPLFNVVQILESKSLSNKVYKAISQKYPEELASIKITSEDKFHNYIKNKLKTKIIPSTDTLTLSLRWGDKSSADSVLLETINQFRNQNLELRKAVETRQREYIDNYLKEIDSRLAAVKRQIRDYRVAQGVVNVNEEGTNILLTKYELEKKIADIKSQIRYNDQKFANFSKQVGFDNAKTALRATAIGQDPYLETLNKSLAETEQRYANLTSKFTDAYPEVIAVKNEISAINLNIGERSKESLGDVPVNRGVYDKPSQDIITDMSRTEAETTSLRAQLASLTQSLKSLHAREMKLPETIAKIEELYKQEDTLKAIYENVKKKQMDAKFKENEIVDNVFILDYPSEPKRYNFDLIIAFVGFIYGGAIVGTLAAWAKESPSNSKYGRQRGKSGGPSVREIFEEPDTEIPARIN